MCAAGGNMDAATRPPCVHSRASQNPSIHPVLDADVHGECRLGSGGTDVCRNMPNRDTARPHKRKFRRTCASATFFSLSTLNNAKPPAVS